MKRVRRQQRLTRLRRLFVEPLEERRLLATFVVNSTGNERDSFLVPGVCDTELNPIADPPIPASGICTLRAAIDSSELNAGPDTIQFAIPGPGVPTINLLSQLGISAPVVLDATTQGAGMVELRSPNGVFALNAGSSGSTIRGFVINSSAGAILIDSDNNFVVGNRIGTDATGTLSLPITGNAIGVFANNNTIGGTSPEDRNIIASSVIGVDVIGTDGDATVGNVIRGNYIGTNAAGTAALGHTDTAVRLLFAQDTTVEGNVIAASAFGVVVAGTAATGNIVSGNMIGTDATGTVSDPDGQPANGDELGNGKGIIVNDAPGVIVANNVIAGSTGIGVDFGYGIHIANVNAGGTVVKGNRIGVNVDGNAVLANKADGVFIERAGNITIGGMAQGDRNIISGNGGDGVAIFGTPAEPAMNVQVLGNYIGVDVTGELDFGNKFRGVHLDSSAANNTIGGDAPAARNIISGNDFDGVIIALPGAAGNVVKGNYIGTDKDGVSDVGNGRNGVVILRAPNNVIGQSIGTNFIRNVIAGNERHGVLIEGLEATGNVVAGNIIGAQVNGTIELRNDMTGVYILNAPKNRVGDVFAELPSDGNFPGNVIAAVEAGVRIEGMDAKENEVLRNLIGVDATGLRGFPSFAESGVHLLDAPLNRIGVPTVASASPGGNTISHNHVGVYIQAKAGQQGTGALGSFLGGNFIGTDYTGSISLPASDLGNRSAGVLIDNSANNYIGGQPTGVPMLPGNDISGNGGDGVRVIGDSAKGNVIGNNTISANSLYGIDLGGDGVTPNDPLDTDIGPNEFQNFPFVSPIVLEGGADVIVGNLHSKPNKLYRIEFFEAFNAGRDGYGDADIFLGSQDVTTDDSGNAAISFTRTTEPFSGRFITATATDTLGSTSEFSCAAPAVVGDGTVGLGRFFGVTTTDDSGLGSLRQAILDANARPGVDTISFCLRGAGPHTISPESMLPSIVDPVIIDGTTQLGARCNTSGLEEATNAQLKIELNGANAGDGAHGLNITAGGSTVRGLVINRFSGSGIRIAVNGGNTIECNFLGTDLTGATALGNQLDGVTIQDSPSHVIGGSTAAARNVISGNVLSGVAISGAGSTSNTVSGNFIGTNAAGAGGVANKTGVRISDATINVVGGDQESHRNVISGNTEDGVEIIDTIETAGDAGLNVIIGNRIGTNASGTAAVANSRGVRILEAMFNAVGVSGAGNLISGNSDAGVLIAGADAINNAIRGNRIGTNATGENALPNQSDGVRLGSDARNNTIGGELAGEGNLISGNGQDGINLEGTNLFPTTDNAIIGNLIGTNPNGDSPVPNMRNGVHLIGFARNNTIGGTATNARNVISGNMKQGVAIVGQNATMNHVVGNLIGTDPSGKLRVRNEEAGVLIDDAPQNVIGLAGTDRRNVISGNLIGVHIKGAGASQNQVLRNLIGTDNTGKLPIGNDEAGVRIEGAPLNVIGGDAAGEGNVISANQFGVHIKGAGATENEISGNRIGTDLDGMPGPDPDNVPLGNLEVGVLIADAAMTLVGDIVDIDEPCDANAFPSNTIAGNIGVGVQVTGNSATGNIIRCNSIHDNDGLGIDLVGGEPAGRQVTPNDIGDADAGPNGLLNFPVVVTYVVDATDPMNPKTIVSGMVEPGSEVIVDLYALRPSVVDAVEGPDPSGFGEGERYLDSVIPDAMGRFEQELGPLPNGFNFISATVTRLADGSTSEFSAVCGYIDAANDGNPDSDGDSLCDDWETNGIDFNGDGIVDLDLPNLTDAQGMNQHHADPLVRDIYVEVDWMDCAMGGCTQNHASHQPVPAALTDVQTAFKNHNIQLHLIPDEALREIETIRFNDGAVKVPPGGTFNDLKVGNPENRCGTGANDGHFGTMAERIAVKPDGTSNCENILAARQLAFRYLIFGHDHAHTPGSSGIAELPGNDFMVTIGSWSAAGIRRTSGLPAGKMPEEYRQVIEAGTIMHEMGHTLNLGHGGGDHSNCKPNYLSIMSYSLQFPYLDPTRPLDYSDQALLPLNENSLNEAAGIGGPAGRFVIFGEGDSGDVPAPLPAANSVAFDWNGDGDMVDAGVRADISMIDGPCKPRANDTVVGFQNFAGPDSGIRGNKNYGNTSLGDFVMTMLSGAAVGQQRDIVGNNPTDITVADFANPIALGNDYVVHQPPQNLVGYDDWSNLLIPFRQTDDYADGISTSHVDDDDIDVTVDDFVAAAQSVDFDADGFSNADDNCPAVPNPAQADTNGDGVADACGAGVRVFVTGDTLHYVAVATQVNRAAFSSQAGSAVVAEATELILEAGENCGGGGLPAESVTCNLTGVARIDVTLDDGADRVEVGHFDIPILVNAGLGDDALRLTGAEQSLDLVTLADTDLRGIETIDIKGAGANSLTLDVDEVINLSDTDELVVLANRDDRVNVGSEWLLTGITIQAGLFFRVLEQGTAKLLLNGPSDWQNPINRLDVNASGSVEPLDVLPIINELNDPQFHNNLGLLADAASLQDFPDLFYDVVPDGFVVPLDALLIINFLNNPGSVAEGEAARVAVFAEGSPLVLAGPSNPTSSAGHAPAAAPRRRRDPNPLTPSNSHLASPPPATPAPATRWLTRAKYARILDDLFADFETGEEKGGKKSTVMGEFAFLDDARTLSATTRE